MDNKIIGIIAVLITVFSGVGIYSGNEWFTHQQYKDLVAEMPENVAVYMNTLDDSRIDIIKKSDKCDYWLTRVTDDETTIKCGYRIAYQFKTYVDYEKTYGFDENLTHKRKVRSIEINLVNTNYDCIYSYVDNITGENETQFETCEKEDHVEVSKSVEYYKGNQRITGGNLKEIYTVTDDGVKLDYNWNPTYNQKSIVRLCFSKFDDSNIQFDGIEEFKEEDGCYYYGYAKGNLSIDPWWDEGANLTNTNCSSNDWIGLDNGSSTVGYDTSGSIRLGFPQEGNLTSYWKADVSGSYPDEMCLNDGSNTGATFRTDCKIGGCYKYVTNDYHTITHDVSLTTTAFSVEAWINTSVNTSGTFIIFKDAGGNNNHDFHIGTSASGLVTQLQAGGASQDTLVSPISTNTFHHVAFTSDGGTTHILYLDGVQVDTSSLSWTLNGNTVPLYFGSWAASTGMTGDIDEVRWYDRVLTSTEVNDSYNSNVGLAYNTSANDFFSDINNTGSDINWIVPTLNITPNSFNASYRVSTDNRSTFTDYLTSSNNSENITVTQGQYTSFDFNLSGNATNSPTIENFGMLSGEFIPPLTFAVLFNYTYFDADGDLGICWQNIDDVLEFTNTSIASGTDIINVKNLTLGDHNWSVICSDDNGVTNVTTDTFFFNVSLAVGINASVNSGVSFSFTPVSRTDRFEGNVSATGQTDNLGLFEVCNNGSVVINVTINVNQTDPLYTLKCDDSNSTASATNLNTTNQTIITNLAIDACSDLWCWVDYNGTRVIKRVKLRLFPDG